MKLFGYLRGSALLVMMTALVGAAGPVSAQSSKVVAGTLTCEGQGTIGMIVGSKETLHCQYAPASGGQSQAYSGTITRVGLDIGVRGKSVLIWTVLGSSSEVPRDALNGNFAGVSADIAAVVGGGANILLGGSARSVVLQPLSIKGETGINVAVGVSELHLVANG